LKDYTENVTKDVERIADEYVKRMQRTMPVRQTLQWMTNLSREMDRPVRR